MASPISPITPLASPALVDSVRTAGEAKSGGSFQDVFSSAIKNVEAFSQQASASAERFLSGEGEELHTAVLATQKAELAFELFLQGRNKIVNAYQEIMRMQL
jgi:flagellar hook-basal body complex protein FliE